MYREEGQEAEAPGGAGARGCWGDLTEQGTRDEQGVMRCEIMIDAATQEEIDRLNRAVYEFAAVRIAAHDPVDFERSLR